MPGPGGRAQFPLPKVLPGQRLSVRYWSAVRRATGSNRVWRGRGRGVRWGPCFVNALFPPWRYISGRRLVNPALGLARSVVAGLSYFPGMDDDAMERCSVLKKTFAVVALAVTAVLAPSIPAASADTAEAATAGFNWA